MLAFKAVTRRLRDGWLALAGTARPLRILTKAQHHLALEQFEQADRLLRDGVRRFPRNPGLHVLFALSADHRRRFADALVRWQAVRAGWPERPDGWCGMAGNLRELGRAGEAWAVVSEALGRFPDEPVVLLETGRVADRLRRAADGLAASRRLVELHPDDPRWRQVHVERLLDQDRLDEARAETERALARQPDEPTLHALAGVVAATGGAWEEAVARWDALGTRPGPAARDANLSLDAALRTAAWRVRYVDPATSHGIWRHLLRRSPDDPHCLDGHAAALIRLGRLDEAAAAVARALDSHPDHRGLRMSEAVLAAKRGRWQDAIDLFGTILARYPDDEDAREALSRASMEAAFARAGSPEAAPIAQPQDVGFVRDDAVRALLLGFESLGEDCEFGLVQRRFGAEPLGLFRWNAVAADTLADALAVGLEGLGDPRNTVVSLWEDAEYYVTDTRWHFGLHTFTTRHEMAEEVVLRKMCARVAYLRDKFLDDLREARKIFVLKADGVDLPTLERLHGALRAVGPVRLLCVQPLSAATASVAAEVRAGQAYRVGEDLALGFVARLGNGIGRWDIQFDDWVSVCRSATAPDLPPLPA